MSLLSTLLFGRRAYPTTYPYEVTELDVAAGGGVCLLLLVEGSVSTWSSAGRRGRRSQEGTSLIAIVIAADVDSRSRRA
jgi:hypothetical protein